MDFREKTNKKKKNKEKKKQKHLKLENNIFPISSYFYERGQLGNVDPKHKVIWSVFVVCSLAVIETMEPKDLLSLYYKSKQEPPLLSPLTAELIQEFTSNFSARQNGC